MLFADQWPPRVPLAGVHSPLKFASAQHLLDDPLAGVGVDLPALSVAHDGKGRRP